MYEEEIFCWGVPEKLLFLLLRAAAAAQEERERCRGIQAPRLVFPCNPAQELTALDKPACEAAGKKPKASSRNSGWLMLPLVHHCRRCGSCICTLRRLTARGASRGSAQGNLLQEEDCDKSHAHENGTQHEHVMNAAGQTNLHRL